MKSFEMLVFFIITENYFVFLHSEKHQGSVVQLYRTSDSGSEGLGLESQRSHFFKSYKLSVASYRNFTCN